MQRLASHDGWGGPQMAPGGVAMTQADNAGRQRPSLEEGLLVGLVYGRIIERQGFAAAMRKALERAGVLYLLTVGVTLPLLLISELLDLPWATGVYFTDPWALVIGVFTLHRTYYLIDVMVLYTLLLAVAPLALYALAYGQTRLLLLASWG